LKFLVFKFFEVSPGRVLLSLAYFFFLQKSDLGHNSFKPFFCLDFIAALLMLSLAFMLIFTFLKKLRRRPDFFSDFFWGLWVYICSFQNSDMRRDVVADCRRSDKARPATPQVGFLKGEKELLKLSPNSVATL